MFSFIRKFFERRKAIAAERNHLCNDLLRRISWALSDYIDASKTKESLQKWIDDKSKLIVELNDISEFKRSSYYKQLKQQRKVFDEFYEQAPNKIKAFIAEERQKRALVAGKMARGRCFIQRRVRRKLSRSIVQKR